MSPDDKPGKKAILHGEHLPAEDAIAPARDDPETVDETAEEWSRAETVFEPDPGAARLALDDDDRLPWLESPDDYAAEGVDGGRIVGFALLGLVALAMIVGAVWWVGNRGDGPGPADGSLIRAESGPYKVAPEEPGGKTFAGTGDSSFAVSEGETRGGKLAGSEPAPAPKPAATTSAEPASAGGVGVQIGAYMTAADAETGWSTLAARHEALSGLSHRVVEGRADIGTVYRLQAVAADLAAANALCNALKAGGQGCQVKR